MFFPVFFTVIWQLNRLNPSKKQAKRATEAVDSSVSELFAVQTEQIKEIIKTKNNQIKSYQQQLRQTEEDSPEIVSDVSGKDVTFEQITELVKVHYPKYSKLLPLFKGEIMKQVKGMTMEEILSYVGTLTGKNEAGDLTQAGSITGAQDRRVDWA